ncbi:MAG: efflux RND transporter periplasmic adaptor subunit [Marinilabiliaceae bacterium]
MRHTLLICVLAAAAMTSCSDGAQVTYTKAKVTRGDISTSITATGTIEPVTKVEVGTQVSGIISKIYVDYNSVVKKGQVIAELDKTNLLSELASAKSQLANAQSDLDYQQANYDRYAALFEKGLVSANDYEQARLSFEQARQQIVIQRQNVAKAQTNLGYATITSPIDGVVLSREVEEGQTVASAMTTPTLFNIAQDLTDMRVIADVDEADIGGVKEGQRVTFTVDAFPDDVFAGNVTQVRKEATTESNVVTYEVVISAPNKDLKLLPGLTANVTVFTAERNGVLTIPSKALRFAPNATLLTPEQSVEDCDSKTKVWTYDGKTFRAKGIETGLNGGTTVEVTSGLSEGDEIVVSFELGGQGDMAATEGETKSNPFMPGPPGQKKKK